MHSFGLLSQARSAARGTVPPPMGRGSQPPMRRWAKNVPCWWQVDQGRRVLFMKCTKDTASCSVLTTEALSLSKGGTLSQDGSGWLVSKSYSCCLYSSYLSSHHCKWGSVQTLEWALGGLVTLYLIMLCSWCIFLQQKTEQVLMFFYRLHLLFCFLLCWLVLYGSW